MREFQYAITDPMGLHARPAGDLVKKAKALSCAVTIAKTDGAAAAATKLMALMKLAIKSGETVTVRVEGENEEAEAAELEVFFKENM